MLEKLPCGPASVSVAPYGGVIITRLYIYISRNPYRHFYDFTGSCKLHGLLFLDLRFLFINRL